MYKNISLHLNKYFSGHAFTVLYSLIGTAIATGLAIDSEVSLIWHLAYGFTLGLALCLGGDHLFKKSEKWKKRLPFLVVALLAIGYLLSSYLQSHRDLLIHLIISCYFLFLLTPQEVRQKEDRAFPWIVHCLIAVGLSLTISLILAGLVLVLYWAMSVLFQFVLPDELRYLGGAILSVFLPINLFTFLRPSPDQIAALQFKLSFRAEKIVYWLFLPLMTTYVLVLLLYALKILAIFSLPQGLVSIPISVAYALYISLYAYTTSQRDQKQDFRKFHRFFVFAFIPLFGMMGFGIFTRIYEYAFTPDRVYLLAIYILILISHSILILKNRLELRYWIAIIAAFFLLTSIRPLSPMEISLRSQSRKVIEIAQSHSLSFESGSAKMDDWSQKDLEMLASALEFVTSNNGSHILEKKSRAAGLLSPETSTDFSSLISRLENTLEQKRESSDACLKFEATEDELKPISVTGYDWYHPLSIGTYSTAIPFRDDIQIEFKLSEGKIIISQQGEEGTVMELADLKAFAPGAPAVLTGRVKSSEIKIFVRQAEWNCSSPSLFGYYLWKEGPGEKTD